MQICENPIKEQRLQEMSKFNQIHELQRLLKERDLKIRHLELEREKLMSQLSDFDRIQQKLELREKQKASLEKQIEQLQRECSYKRYTIDPPIIQPMIQQIVTPASGICIETNEDIIQLREDVLYLSKQRNTLVEEVNYWKRRQNSNIINLTRFLELENAGDRAVSLLAHQNMQFSQHINYSEQKLIDNYQRLKTNAQAFINDLRCLNRHQKIIGFENLMNTNLVLIQQLSI